MYTADYPPGARLPARVIDDIEFAWMLRGRARFRTAEQDVLLTPDVMLLVPPGLRHSFDWDPQRPSRHGYVHFERPDLAPDVQIRAMAEPLRGLCGYLLAEERAAAQTIDLMLTVIKLGAIPALVPRLSSVLRTAVGHLRAEWAEMPLSRITVQSLADVAHISRGYLNRLFQNAFDVSAATALERIRCARAETLLARSDLTIDTIARQCGFADVSHFSHRFTLLHGMPPSGYRANPVTSVLNHPGIRRLNQHIIEPSDGFEAR